MSPFITNSNDVAALNPTLLWAGRKWIINTIKKIPLLYDFFGKLLCNEYNNILSSTQPHYHTYVGHPCRPLGWNFTSEAAWNLLIYLFLTRIISQSTGHCKAFFIIVGQEHPSSLRIENKALPYLTCMSWVSSISLKNWKCWLAHTFPFYLLSVMRDLMRKRENKIINYCIIFITGASITFVKL